jgi:hypothetical protein
VVVVVIEIVNKRVWTSSLPVCQRTSAVPYRHRPIHYGEYHDWLNRRRERAYWQPHSCISGHHTTGSTHIKMTMEPREAHQSRDLLSAWTVGWGRWRREWGRKTSLNLKGICY